MSAQEAEALKKLAYQIPEYAPFVRIVDDEEHLKEKLGAWYAEGGTYVTTPEAPFPEADVLQEIREMARLYSGFVEVDGPCQIGVSKSRQVELTIGEECFEPGVVLIAAGAGIVPLLEQIWPTHPFRLRLTPLCVVRRDVGMQAGVFVDSIRNFSVVRHGDRSVVGFADSICPREVGWSYCDPEERAIGSDTVAAIRSFMCEHLNASLREPVDFRITAGVEPLVVDDDGTLLPDFSSRVFQVPDFPNVVVAVPGRATRSWVCVKDEVVPLLCSLLDSNRDSSPHTAVTSDWVDDVHMHFHSKFDTVLNDCGNRP